MLTIIDTDTLHTESAAPVATDDLPRVRAHELLPDARLVLHRDRYGVPEVCVGYWSGAGPFSGLVYGQEYEKDGQTVLTYYTECRRHERPIENAPGEPDEYLTEREAVGGIVRTLRRDIERLQGQLEEAADELDRIEQALGSDDGSETRERVGKEA